MAMLVLTSLDATILAAATVLVLAGWVAAYVFAKRMLTGAVEQLRQESEKRVNALYSKLSATAMALPAINETKTSEQVVEPAATLRPPALKEGPAPGRALASPASATIEEVSPEILLVISAAVTAFLGKKVRIRSARTVPGTDAFSAWAQQGRVFVQASHNLTQRGH